MLKNMHRSPVFLFLLPVIAAAGLFTFLNLNCQLWDRDASGSLKILYTSDTGGKLDPCG